ncbi:uncharacterized protein KNAG_0C01570 [Huiozyma naganishii CBS 8797]|uniref:Inclusion body clearance protein IML2 n=1 Tax=Huiozyma naganishii (strain ATCC MYA-139 / BCRC 22969 / CBS 8797 / KCTC 17520 / NBRC 10181 / NCYC 3082 / Yp74L-3) TaxID=1071383 RepID=J7R361_HUIN7|nr:hypothetical protein KNAG_0C01570 [Kazachstania naganishii CBS 8797]CCK69270.1 hypothetical protein KNAG_0C01570 [Kazachstania naganishii CBS 8797]
MFKSFFGSKEPTLSREEMTKVVLKQAHDFEIALKAMDYVLDDRAEQGLYLLEQQRKQLTQDPNADETINILARGVIEFLEATLSFEIKEMKIASETLGKAEQLSLKSKARVEKEKIKSSSVYPPGTLYAVTYTESCLLHALLMLFSESMMEAAKAVLKLRKAYYTLQEIFETIKKAREQGKKTASTTNTTTTGNDSSQRSHSSSSASFISMDGKEFVSADIPYKLSQQEQKDKEILEYAELVHTMKTARLSGGHIDNSPAINRLRDELGLEALNNLPRESVTEHTYLSHDIDDSQATVDEFIDSGVSLCFGILQVVLSLLPPAIGAVLSVIGFKGSREEGLRLVWRSTKQRNVHGCIGLLALMFYYDGPFQFTDDDFDIPATTSPTQPSRPMSPSLSRKSTEETIGSRSAGTRSVTSQSDSKKMTKLSSAQSSAHQQQEGNSVDTMDEPTLLHPGKILEKALLQARALFPNSALWLLNEARMLSGKGRLREAVQLMDSIDVNHIHMRQVKVLMIFDRAITLVHLHEYDRAADDLLALIDISDWSHALYTYFAGCCYLENWRRCTMGLMDEKNSKGAEWYKTNATKLIFSASDHLGKKTFKAKNLPLDRFMLRKVEQFRSMQKSLKLDDPLDAIATSPVHELAYFYNGYNRMTQDGLQLTMKMLTEFTNPAIEAKNPDQELIKDILVSLTLRRLGKIQEGCDILDQKVLPQLFTMEYGKVKYVKKTEDPWAYPTAFYERALFCWKLNGMNDLPESREWLVRAQNYAADYELSTRVGMKIKAALDRVEHSMT